MPTSKELLLLIPDLQPDEFAFLEAFTVGIPEEKLKSFIRFYSAKRKRPEIVLICTLLGFVGFAGIQRFLLGQMGMGVLYFFTGGLCVVGTIVDIINHKQLTFEYNQKMAQESMVFVG
ncbi:MAG: TM2 domain-containing protein [Ferruginibacter sp.]